MRKAKIKADLNTRSSYKLYKENTEAPLESKVYLDIANGFMDFIIQKVLEGETVTLPGRLGTLSIIGTKRTIRYNEQGLAILPPDWNRTKKLRESDPEAKAQRKVVYCLNEHSGGISYKFFWSKLRVALENKSLYCLRLTRKHKRELNRLITQEGKEYPLKF